MTGDARTSRGDFWALMFFVVALADLVIYFAMATVCNIMSQVRSPSSLKFKNSEPKNIT
jgi:uncharacterized membrane protein YhaH (DUF805 family)